MQRRSYMPNNKWATAFFCGKGVCFKQGIFKFCYKVGLNFQFLQFFFWYFGAKLGISGNDEKVQSSTRKKENKSYGRSSMLGETNSSP